MWGHKPVLENLFCVLLGAPESKERGRARGLQPPVRSLGVRAAKGHLRAVPPEAEVQQAPGAASAQRPVTLGGCPAAAGCRPGRQLTGIRHLAPGCMCARAQALRPRIRVFVCVCVCEHRL